MDEIVLEQITKKNKKAELSKEKTKKLQWLIFSLRNITVQPQVDKYADNMLSQYR